LRFAPAFAELRRGTAKRLQTLTGEALESDEAAASEYIFLRTASVLETPSAWPWLFPSPWQLVLAWD